jgi:2-C-methyl-D-erythritol 4-phosphate cytidylyltransferase/2-C-methyl-D-erythritol 2,4-cyclodiphosphate synthase
MTENKIGNKINVIITAGGKSLRFGGADKLFQPVGASFVLLEAIKPFLGFGRISKIIVAICPENEKLFLARARQYGVNDPRIVFVSGGETRTDSVKNAIKKLEDDCDTVLVHDGARPFASPKLIEKIIEGTIARGAAVPLVKNTDALVKIENGYAKSVNRDNYLRVQTPAGFEKNRFIYAYAQCDKQYFDDISVIQAYQKGDVAIVEGEASNIKITTKADLGTYLSGCGYDIHRLKDGNGIKLNGVFIPCDFSFVAHSDGDVPVHALMDAILSAAGEHDIGHLFPVDDAKYDDADSIKLLEEVVEIANIKGFEIQNVSITIITENPKLSPYIDEMRRKLSGVLEIPFERVGICATTNEQVGEIGAGKAVAAYATVMLKSR